MLLHNDIALVQVLSWELHVLACHSRTELSCTCLPDDACPVFLYPGVSRDRHAQHSNHAGQGANSLVQEAESHLARTQLKRYLLQHYQRKYGRLSALHFSAAAAVRHTPLKHSTYSLGNQIRHLCSCVILMLFCGCFTE